MDRKNDLAKCISSLITQKTKFDELIIVDASINEKNIMPLCKKLLADSGIILKFFHTKPGNSYQRNVGIDNVDENSDFVCFFDDDVILFEDTLQNVISTFKNYPDVCGVQGIEINRKPQNIIGKIVRKIFFIAHEDSKWRLLPSGENTNIINPKHDIFVGSVMVGLSCFKRSILNKYRFDEWFKEYAFLEDYEFSYRLSRQHSLLVSPKIRFIHNKSLVARGNNYYSSKMYIINKTYIFLKHISKNNMFYWIAFIWSLLGHIILSAGKSICQMDGGYFFGTCAGIISIRSIKFKENNSNE